MKKLLIIALTAVCALCACVNKSTNASSVETDNKVLVLYYSQTGATKTIAEELQSRLNCDIAALEAVVPYDGDYDATIQRWMKERDSILPELKPLARDIADYDTIFLGFPIWGGSYALPMKTFLANNKLDGKVVVTFATFGSGGIVNATTDVATAQPNATVIKGYGVRNARISKAPAEIERFLIEGGYISGEIDALPDYSEAIPVTETETKVFNDACSSYKFPLGTPTRVATRKTDTGIDYRFDVKSQTPDGAESTSTIYVTVENGQAPEFTEVVR